MSDWRAGLDAAMKLLNHGQPKKCLVYLRALLDEHGRDEMCRAFALEGMGRAFFGDGQPGPGLEALRESAAILRRLFEQGKIAPGTLLGALQNFAHALMLTGNYNESVNAGKEAVEIAEKNFPPDSPLVARALFTLSAPYYEMKDYDQAEACLLRAKKILEARQGERDQQIGTILNNLGRIYEERGQLEQGIEYHRQAVDFRRKLPNREDLAFSLGNYGVALGSGGKLQAACAALEECLEVYGELKLADGPLAKAFKSNLELFRRSIA